MNKMKNYSKEVGVDGVVHETLEKRPSAFARFVRKYPVFTTIVCGLLVVVLVYFWKEVEGKMKRKALIEMASTRLQENTQVMLTLFCKPMVWSIRSEMLRGNMEQIDLLIRDLVKEKNFQYIYLVDSNGSVLLSTNKRQEGKPIDNEQIISALAADSIVVLNETDHIFTVVSPVMGYDKQLATLVFSYQSEVFNPDLYKKD